MIPRYARPEMTALWAPESKYAIWLEIETLAAEAMESLGQIPLGTSAAVREKAAIEFKPSRENRSRDVFIMQDDMWAVATLRPTKNEALAKTGDSEKRQVVTELTLVCRNEAASGGIFDCSTS